MAIYKDIVKKIPISAEKKTKQKQYLSCGVLPIIDQGQQIIGGYTNDISKKIDCDLPVIVFGDHTRCVKLIKFAFAPGADGIKVVRPVDNSVLIEYLFYATKYLTTKIRDKGYARHYQDIEKQELEIPTVLKQKEIVLKLEKDLSSLDNAVETLNKTKKQLTVYRQAVLKEAFEGNLTDSSKKSIELLGEFIEKPRYGTSKKCDYQSGETFKDVYRIPNIDAKSGVINHDDIKRAEFEEKELNDLDLKSGDILIIRSNGSLSIVGTAAMVRENDINGTFAGYLMRLRIKDIKTLLPKFLLFYLASFDARTYIEHVSKSTSGVNNINAQEVAKIPIPFFEIGDQEHIISEIESRVSMCGQIEKIVNQALYQADAMRQSILKEAFEGRLA